MARMTFRCSRGEKCPNNTKDYMGTKNGPGEFCLFFQHWFEGSENQLVQWRTKGIRCGCGAPFASISFTEPNLPDEMQVTPLTDEDVAPGTAVDVELEAMRAAFAAELTEEEREAVRKFYGGAMPWETPEEAPTSPETPEAIAASEG